MVKQVLAYILVTGEIVNKNIPLQLFERAKQIENRILKVGHEKSRL